jgi:hypothetical protein
MSNNFANNTTPTGLHVYSMSNIKDCSTPLESHGLAVGCGYKHLNPLGSATQIKKQLEGLEYE